MISFDTNLAVYAANLAAVQHKAAAQFIASLASHKDVVICELMLVELYLKLRNPIIFPKPLTADEAAKHCRRYRENPFWRLVDSAPVMEQVWQAAAKKGFPVRRIIDARLALTLRHHGVADFATSNEKDFSGFGFRKVWNPLAT